MENASKALIIIASVLVAIMIVALGVTIFTKAQNSADTSSLDQTEINMFNSKFERYAGNQNGSQVKSLISYAISNASTNSKDPAKLPQITFEGNEEGEDKIKEAENTEKFGEIRKNIISTHTYWVELSYATDTGLVNLITIKWEKE